MARTATVHIQDDEEVRRNSYVSAIQAKKMSKANEAACPVNIQAIGRDLELLVRSAYMRSRVWLNIRADHATVKVEAPSASDKMNAYRDTALMEFLRKHSITSKTMSNRSLIFRVD